MNNPPSTRMYLKKAERKKILQFLEFSFDGFLFEEENENFRLFS